MSLKDELDMIAEEKLKKDSQMLTDEETYQVLLQHMYQELLVQRIKDCISKGETHFQGEFPLFYEYSTSMYNNSDTFPWDRITCESSIHKKGSEEGWRYCRFKELYTEKKGVFKPRAELTPLGYRVYEDIKGLALKDNIKISEPISKVYTYSYRGKGWAKAGLVVKFEYSYLK